MADPEDIKKALERGAAQEAGPQVGGAFRQIIQESEKGTLPLLLPPGPFTTSSLPLAQRSSSPLRDPISEQAGDDGGSFLDRLFNPIGIPGQQERREFFQGNVGSLLDFTLGTLGQGFVDIGKTVRDPSRLKPSFSGEGGRTLLGSLSFPNLRPETQQAIAEFTEREGRPPGAQEQLELAKEATPQPRFVRGALETLPLLAVPAAVPARAALLARGGTLGRAGAAALEPLAAVERLTGAAIKGTGRGIQLGTVKALDRFGIADPTTLGKNVLNLKPVRVGLTKTEELLNMANEALGRRFGGVEKHPLVSAAFRERARVRPAIENQAAVIGALSEAEVNSAFALDARGRIAKLAGIDAEIVGAPTIQDVAARFPRYVQSLTPDQRVVMERLRDRVGPYRELFTEVGHEVASRPDVIQGGFYLPRGRAAIEGADEAIKITSGRGGGGKKGFERTTRFDSMAQGIDEGFEYAPLREALASYAQDAGTRSTERHIGNIFLGASDAEGRLLATSAADRISPFLKSKIGNLRAKIAGRRLTLIRQAVRTATQDKEVARLTRAADKLAEVVAGADMRFEAAYLEGNTDDIIKAALKEIAVLLKDEQRAGAIAAGRGGAVRVAEGEAGRTATTAVKLSSLADAASERFATRTQFSSRTDVIKAAERELDIVLRETRKATNRAIAAAGRVTGATKRASAARKARNAAKNLVAAARKRLRDIPVTGTSADALKAARKELTLLSRALKRAERDAGSARQRAEATALRREVTGVRYDELRDELSGLGAEWDRAKKLAAQTPRGAGVIDLPFLSGYAFPDDIANAANKILQQERARGTDVERLLTATNQLYRGFNATADNSAIGIQGLLGWGSSQGASMKALRTNIEAWGRGGDASLGKAFMSFDDAARTADMPLAQDWARLDLRMGGAKTEFTLGQGVTARFANLPGIRNANRAFGFYGDVLRLFWSHNELADVVAKSGKSVAQLRASGQLEREMSQIAKAINGATGWSENRTFGSLGELLLFAPRFLQSRLETLARGIGIQGGPLEQRIARRALLRLVGLGTVLTEAANFMLGQETDHRFIVNGRKNPNFMRIRYGGRDWSAFGTWDSLAGLIVAVGTGRPDEALRSVGSGLVANAWDFLSGSNAIGERVRDDPGQVANRLMQNFVPFSGGELGAILPKILKGVREGNKRDVVAGGVALGGEFIGMKSAPLSASDKIGDAREQVVLHDPALAREIIDDLGVDAAPDRIVQEAARIVKRDPNSISPLFLSEIDSNEDVAEAKGERADQQTERRSAFQIYKNERDKIDAEHDSNIAKAAAANGASRAFIDILDTNQATRAIRKNQLRDDSASALSFFDDDEPRASKMQAALDDYIDVLFNASPPLEDLVTGQYDFDRRQGIIFTWQQRHSDKATADVLQFLRRDEHPLAAELRQDREKLREYWAITERTIVRAGVEDDWEQYLKTKLVDKSKFLRDHPRLKSALRAAKILKEHLRRTGDPEIERLLIKWEYIGSPLNPRVKADVILRQFREGQAAPVGGR